MKKLLFAAHNLDLGGIETALVTMVNYLSKNGYDVTIALEKKEGVFLDRINEKINIIEYNTSSNKNIILRKLENLINRIKFIIKYKDKYDFSASFATYSLACSFMARVASKNSALWGHADYLTLYNGKIEEMKQFFNNLKCKKFKHIIFVSKEGATSFIKAFQELKNKVIICNNLIDGEKIKQKAEENIIEENIKDIKKGKNIPIFLNVGRHDERQKKLTRIIEATKKLKDEGYLFKVIFIGDGQDTKNYLQEVEKFNLKDTILFLGRKENPYPYFKISDYIILSSEYEGYPVVYLESFVLNKPIITTKVSDFEQVENRGIVVEKTIEGIYNAMKEVTQKGYEIKEVFDYEKYNKEILKKLEEIF